MDRVACWATVHGVTSSQTCLSTKQQVLQLASHSSAVALVSAGSAPTNSEPTDMECHSPTPFNINCLSTGRFWYLWGLLGPVPCRYPATTVCSVDPFPSNLVQKFLKTSRSHGSALCVRSVASVVSDSS